MNKLLTILLVCSISILNGQDIYELSFDEYFDHINELNKNYSNNVSYKVTYKTFENHTTDIPYDVFSGYFIKKGNVHEVLQLGAYVYQDENARYVVDTSRKSIVITSPKSNESALENFLENKDFLNANYLDKIILKKTNESKIYTIKLKNFKYNKIVVIVKNDLLKKIVMLFDQPVIDKTVETNNVYYPRVEIDFFEVNTTQPVHLKKKFNPSIHIKKIGEKYKSLGKYSAYKVFDARINKNNK